ncbi:MAG: acyl-ACP--UDP-N-acetylglucosamine O-acyltransferase [Halobacteriovoraceae bacterium]|nr:acyl-ACP--UDP-N-acetylglucosamine O-acyltransferase [Halobacteriovoraceae bacterium]MCB9095478.1 acyl-ACP--UDP-N-acetylglucosamine O-acyltransferase [Halobacteriovoraceae bacterium]
MSAKNIHPTAVISDGAVIGEETIVGPYCFIGPNVKIGNECQFHSHVVVDGHTTIGNKNSFSPYTTVGTAPQDISYQGEPTRVEIGDNNVFREFVSINRGTLKQDQVTIIGNNNLVMAYCHFGHDVRIDNNIRVVNACNLAGHVHIQDNAILSGITNISQFITVGRGAFIGGGSTIDRDIPCYSTAYGNRIKLKGINIIGLKRMGISKQEISEVVDFYRSMEASALSPKTFIESEEAMKEYTGNSIVQEIVGFIKNSKIGIPPFMS